MANTVDSPQSQLDKTVRIFDSFYNFDLVIDASQYEIVYSYFRNVCKSDNVAKNFTTMLFRVANITNENPQTLLEYMYGSGTSKLKVNALMAYYLNSIKSKTTLYGVSITPPPNEFIQRNIIV
jgi:hypothetical protein